MSDNISSLLTNILSSNIPSSPEFHQISPALYQLQNYPVTGIYSDKNNLNLFNILHINFSKKNEKGRKTYACCLGKVLKTKYQSILKTMNLKHIKNSFQKENTLFIPEYLPVEGWQKSSRCLGTEKAVMLTTRTQPIIHHPLVLHIRFVMLLLLQTRTERDK